ncbi:UDP-4-amino-4,6-dideoxy-N-acetyl-beta-L-altrosamine transaminase [Haliovirga abyssi]|uniref:UDP-4-amino-4, 6-dideoxy-N-acetyl-beta-L-altrosamine transaminase n=1 Tax=Haliovirga abyssi TaxID=2996794 RepID=A0AAU9DEV0_9FUSO|nr:UDP-4-amino-4,6-dideoxy-N-acetyl-beta-L-altrosamine transaminase [Haliovirga abyssi]BDU49882.1 UDP-4-amino-4,6-dideoxy-N-acetyl-beta-L-altrosamine transaminase [Haliovirga abyssi]
MEKKYGYGKQWIFEEDINEVVKVLKSDFLTQGPKVEEFEKKIADYIGTKYAVVFSNGTAALHGAYFAGGLKKDDEVITTPITFLATSNAAIYLGGIPKFVDIDINSYNIDVNKIEEKITNKTKMIVPVSYGGYPVNILKIKDIAKKYNLIVIEDAAHALGATRNGIKVGKEADMTMFSFHPIKHITTGEGGVIVTDNKDYFEKLKIFRNHGIVKDKKKLINIGEEWYYEMQYLGYNYRMTDFQAALGVSQLKKIDNFVKRRREIANIYGEAFKNIDNIKLPPDSEKNKNVYHLYPILVDKRDELYRELKKVGINCQINYIPIYKQPYYKEKFEYNIDEFKNSELFYLKELSIPMYPKLKDEDINYIIEIIIEKIKKL